MLTDDHVRTGESVAGVAESSKVPLLRRLGGLAQWAPIASAAAYLLFLILQFRRILGGVYWNSDAAFAQVLVGGSDLASGGRINVGEASHFSTMWFLQATKSLPFREQVWDVAPFVISLAGVALIAWACWKVAGVWAAAITFALGLSAGPLILATTLPQGMRSHTWFGNSVLVAFLYGS